MGLTKRMFEEIEETRNMLFFFKKHILNSKIEESRKDKMLSVINYLLENVDHHGTRELIIELLHPVMDEMLLNENYFELNPFPLELTLEYLNSKLKDSSLSRNRTVNSEEYYNQKIKELQLREEELKLSLTQNKNETEGQKKLAQETQEKLKLVENELLKKKQELELKQKQEDARNDWERKINQTFNNLKEYLKPLETEHSRLNILYNFYAILGLITLLLIVICEITLLYKIAKADTIPSFSEYVLVLLPLPIAGALMWGFIFQMNRAQRQLVAISNNIHSTKYIQGLLLSINDLSLDINDSIVRVNTALDKIIANHLNRKNISNEIDQKNEEGKDNIEFDKLLKIISTIKK